MTALFEKLDRGLTGIRLYGIAPPKLATDPERLREIAAQQVARLRMLAPDGLVVYDIQDELGRSGQARPFPFLPTVDPEVYAYDALAELETPKIVYRCVGAQPREVFSSWIDTVRAADRRVSVFVGAPGGRSHNPGLPLAEAYTLARAAPNLVLGGIAIAERHVAKGDEHQRILAKQDSGCRFFITQSVYDAASTRSLLSDYALSLQAGARSPAPVVLTFSPCGSVRTLEFMKWLGISFPRWLENELRHSVDTLERSIDLCESVFTDVQDYAREKHLPIGINVESVSIRKAEVDASVELFRRLSSRLGTLGPRLNLVLRRATSDDAPALETLIAASARVLGQRDYSSTQIEAAIGTSWALDRQLIQDGSLWIAEVSGEIVGCGGWSRRHAVAGASTTVSEADMLSPGNDAARIRGFFVHPQWARRGIGTELLKKCEGEARAAGFHSLELLATLPGERLYASRGYISGEPYEFPLGLGQSNTVVPMRKRLPDP